MYGFILFVHIISYLTIFLAPRVEGVNLCPQPTYLGVIKHDFASYVDAFPNGYGQGVDLFISSFRALPFSNRLPTRSNSVSRIPFIDLSLNDVSELKATPIDRLTRWPNGARLVPADVYIPGTQSSERVIVCGGFLLPTNGNGECVVYDINELTQKVKEIVIAKAGPGYFFHHAEFYDVDGDGWKDLITAQATKPFLGLRPSNSSLMWYKNPGDSSPRLDSLFPWKGQVLLEGPDVYFHMEDLDGDSIPEIIATQFFTEKLTIHWVTDGAEFGGGPSNWRSRTLADGLGPLFNLTVAKLFDNGKTQVIFTNHVAEAATAGVYAVEITANFRTENIVVHTLQSNFPVKSSTPGAASPGGVIPFELPGQAYPLMVLSGDGNFNAYIICKASGDDWSWQRDVLLESNVTIGGVAVCDVDGDQLPEIFVPAYDKNGGIHVFSYNT